MTYSAVPDMRIPYDNDGSVVGYVFGPYTSGIASWATGGQLLEMQDEDTTAALGYTTAYLSVWWFFPEQREVTAFFVLFWKTLTTSPPTAGPLSWWGSADTTNGLDGTWEVPSLAGGAATYVDAYSWRSNIKPVSFTGAKKVLRAQAPGGSSNNDVALVTGHWYGEKAAGQTPDDIIYIDHDTTPGVEFAAVEDFGDRPLATTVTRQFRIKNTSATLTANTVNIQCNDTDFIISTDGVTWVVTINIATLGPGVESATMYIRDTTPAAGGLLGPRFARIVTIVGSWT